MQGFGAVDHSPAEPVFHEPWEGRARVLLEAGSGAGQASGGETRPSIERVGPGPYPTSSYYEHWLTAAAALAVQHGVGARGGREARAARGVPAGGPVAAGRGRRPRAGRAPVRAR